MHVRMVRVIRFLFSAMMACLVLGGDFGVVRLFSKVEFEGRSNVWIC